MNNFIPNKKIKENIEKGNISGLRRALITIMLSDRTFSTKDFDNTLDYLKQSGINIYENFNNGELLSKKCNPTEDDFGEAVYNLKDNFCKERIEDVKRLSKILYGKSTPSRTAVRTSATGGGSVSQKKSQGHQMAQKKQESNKGLIVAGVVTVAAIAVIVGMAIKSLNN